MQFSRLSSICTAICALSQTSLVNAFTIDPNDPENIKQVASDVAWNMVHRYHGNETGQSPGWLPDPYYWWLAGGMWGTLVEYWSLTGDASYVDITTQALQFQKGENNDFEPRNVTAQLGNDDQAFWTFAVLSAAELNFPDPPAGQPGWLALAQAVFNRQANRWDAGTCGGGLRWQVSSLNLGYNYKNTVSNGGFIQIAARLYRYTRNETYHEWVDKMYDWMENQTPMISHDGNVYDGSSTEKNCTDVDHTQWTYNQGMFVSASAYMYNATGSQIWRDRLAQFIDKASIFFPYDGTAGPVMVEVACETIATCNEDQPSFKAYFSRNLAVAARLAPEFHDTIMGMIRPSAIGAAQQCSGGQFGTTCGRFWNQTTYDGYDGVGEQMSGLSVIQNMLIDTVPAPVTADTGGTSIGDPSAGSSGEIRVVNPFIDDPITTGDKAGAGILTALLLVGTAGMTYFMVT